MQLCTTNDDQLIKIIDFVEIKLLSNENIE